MSEPALHATAPVRLDFAGGWTDVPPFSEREGGVVVNATIGLHTHAELTLGGSDVRLVSEDLGEEVLLPLAAPLPPASGGVALLLAGARRLGIRDGGWTLRTRSDTPPGSGLGSSGAVGVAVAAVLSRARGETLEPEEIARRAWTLEAVEAGMPGGKQDQWAAALGGFLRLEFSDPDVRAERLALDPAFLEVLARRTVLCYTGRSRVSGETIARVMGAYREGDRQVSTALRALAAAAREMAEALRSADLARVGALLSENWRQQCALDPGMRTAEMTRLEAAVASAGVLGGKAAGAGAGGAMFFLARDDPATVAAAARAAGADVFPVTWSQEGVRTW